MRGENSSNEFWVRSSEEKVILKEALYDVKELDKTLGKLYKEERRLKAAIKATNAVAKVIGYEDIKLDTGSSMMPQKRNPDPLEVTKAKAALAHGHLQSLISIGRSLFLGYNRDTQWTKYLILDLIVMKPPQPQR